MNRTAPKSNSSSEIAAKNLETVYKEKFDETELAEEQEVLDRAVGTVKKLLETPDTGTRNETLAILGKELLDVSKEDQEKIILLLGLTPADRFEIGKTLTPLDLSIPQYSGTQDSFDTGEMRNNQARAVFIQNEIQKNILGFEKIKKYVEDIAPLGTARLTTAVNLINISTLMQKADVQKLYVKKEGEEWQEVSAEKGNMLGVSRVRIGAGDIISFINPIKTVETKRENTEKKEEVDYVLSGQWIEAPRLINLRDAAGNKVGISAPGEKYQIVEEADMQIGKYNYKAVINPKDGSKVYMCYHVGGAEIKGNKMKDNIVLDEMKKDRIDILDNNVLYKVSDFNEGLLEHVKTSWNALNLIPESRRKEALCSAYIIHTLDMIYGDDFIDEVGLIEKVDGVRHFRDAWMMTEGLLEKGYAKESFHLRDLYVINEQKNTIRLDNLNSEYKQKVDEFIEASFDPVSNRGLILFHYKHTETNPKIIENIQRDEDGNINPSSGSSNLNSHATLSLGIGTREFMSPRGGINVADAIILNIKDKHGGRSYDNMWKKNRHLLSHLKNVTLDAHPVSFDGKNFRYENNKLATVTTKTVIQYDDVQITDFYHYHPSASEGKKELPIARVVGLTEMMIQGNFEPVSIIQFDHEEVDVVENKSEVDIRGTFEVGDSFNDSLRLAYEDTFKEKLSSSEIDSYRNILVTLNLNPDILGGKDEIPLFDLTTIPIMDRFGQIYAKKLIDIKNWAKKNIT